VIIRPYGIVIDGALERGIELVIVDDAIEDIRPHTGMPELYVISPVFINAHSHLEYRGLLGKIDAPDYPSWIREITGLKKLQTPDEIYADCLLAAKENIATGVGFIYEHSDRPFAARALKGAGLQGFIYQEVITILEHESPEEKYATVEANAKKSRESRRTFINPHAYHTVDRDTLKKIAALDTPLSIHAAETSFENQLTREGTGPIADFYRANNVPIEVTGKSVISSLDDLGLIRNNTQLVHCCALEEGDIDLIKKRGASVAHCPRSNARLQCPPAPIRELIDAGIPVGLGLDSAASSGHIDMFAEMRAALKTSEERGRAITPEEIWIMATTAGGISWDRDYNAERPWLIEKKGPCPPLIKIYLPDAVSTEDLIEKSSPEHLEWISTNES
jgi:cytosine/adenosine deaminase-related metal-dependent hydrolase